MNAELNSFAIVFIGLVLFGVIPYCVFIAHRDSRARANEETQSISGVITRQKKPSSLAIKASSGETIFYDFKTTPWNSLRGAVVGDTVEVKYF